MGEAALAITPAPDAAPAAPTAPAPAAAPEAPSAAPAAAPPVEGGAAPSGAGPDDTPPPPPGPPPVPYTKFREAQVRATRLERARAEAEQRFQAHLRQREQEWNQAKAQLETQANQYREFQQVLQDHPDLADQLYERLTKAGATPAQAKAQVANLPPEVLERLERMERQSAEARDVLIQARQQQAQAAREAQLQAVQTELDSTIKKIFTDRQYKCGDELTKVASHYVLWRVQNMEDADMSDVAPLVAEFLMPIEREFQARLQAYREGKTQDRSIPPVPGGPQHTALTSRPSAGANDNATSDLATQMLVEKLGWKPG